jgi:hypothetical protein
MITLAELQRRFSQVVKNEGFAIDSLPSSSTPRFPAKTRVEVYRYAYHARIVGVLEYTFAWSVKVLGKRRGGGILRDFLAAQPSRYRSIDEVGQNFPAYLAERRLDKEIPYLLELARFEWICNLCEVTAHGKESSKVRLKPSSFLFESSWPVHTIAEAGKKPKTLRRKPTRLLIYRLQGDAWWVSVSKKDFELLERMALGMDVADAGQLLLEKGFSPEQARKFFMKWSAQGAFSPFKKGKN